MIFFNKIHINLSYTYQDKVRDLSGVINAAVKAKPSILEFFGGIFGGEDSAAQTKHEWLQDIVAPKQWIVNANYTSGTSITLVSTTGVKVGDILGFEKLTGGATNGVTSDYQVIVTAIPDATTLTIAAYGGTSSEAITSTSKIFLVSRPQPEGNGVGNADLTRLPTTEWNQTQIFERIAKVSKTAQVVKKYGIENAIDREVEVQLQDLGYELAKALVLGTRVERNANNNGTFGGLLYYMKRANGNKVTYATDLVSTVNKAIALAVENGGIGVDTLIMSPLQKRKFADIYADKIRVVQEDKTRGIEVSQFYGDLGNITRIVAIREFDKDKIAVVDSSKHKVVQLIDRGFTDEDATPKGADYYARVVRGEITYECLNAEAQTLILECPL